MVEVHPSVSQPSMPRVADPPTPQCLGYLPPAMWARDEPVQIVHVL